MDLNLGAGCAVRYERISEGTIYADFVAEHSGKPPTVFQKSLVWWEVNHWELAFQDATIFCFPDSYHATRGVDGAVIAIPNPQGQEIKFVRNATHTLKSINSPPPPDQFRVRRA